MLMVITSALVETLVKHMFNKYLDERSKIEIGGAPSWYMQPIDDRVCTFAHKKAGIDMIDSVKSNAKYKMQRSINDTIEIAIYENMKNVTNKKEKDVVDKFKNDNYLPMFINKNINYSKVVYEDEIDTIFVRSCIPKNVIIEYQTQRLKDIKKEVSKVKASSAYSDLDLEMKGLNNKNNPNDPFSELPDF